MSTEITDIINSAISQENQSHEFYLRMANLVSQAETKETFQYLAQEELEHKAFLQSCFTPEGCKLVGHPQNVHLAEHLQAPEITPDMPPKEALVIAMKQEESAHRFYQTLAGLQPPGEIRSFLEKMAQMELSHKEKMEYLYDNTAFPEVWHED
ncbi:MAG: ferritin-like domain-containing protein [Desulfobaccales bacterium]